tara:strand:+ start:138 stop:545 length:408 start_codon:yes stop_codon:yes gene_type:complete
MNKFTYLLLTIIIYPSILSSNGIDDLKLPKDFEISIYADEIKSARQMAESSEGIIYVGSKSGDSIYAILDKDNDNFAETKILVASGLSNPTGVAFKDEKVWGRPSAPFVKSDGSLLISDDKYNVIYRVTYSQDKI